MVEQGNISSGILNINFNDYGLQFTDNNFLIRINRLSTNSDIKINIGEEIFEQINKIETNKPIVEEIFEQINKIETNKPIVEEKIINKTETKKSKIKNIFS